MEQEPKSGPQSGGINVSGGNISAQNIAGRDIVNQYITNVPAAVFNPLHQLPTPPADFTGRADELKELLQAVKIGGVAISGLQGLGGVGKTALALKLAEQLKPDYPDAQFYLDLKGVSSQPLTPRDAMAYVVRAWHPTEQLPEKEEELAPLYRSVLDGKRALLLMDNARDAQQVAPLVPPSGCLLVVTSRKHFTLPGLFEKNLDKLPPNDARDLILRIAPRLKKEKTEQVDELARLCGYLPLALRAVARALQEKKNFSPAEYAKRLADIRQRLKLTETDAVLQSSYELLSDDLQQKFRSLSVFPDTFNQAAAAAVWELPLENAQDALSELLTYSLVEFDEITNRYTLHDLVRLFADQLLTVEEQYSAQMRHAGHYLQVLAVADALYLKGGASVTEGLALFDAEWVNIHAGQAWAAQTAEDQAAAAICWAFTNCGAYCLHLRLHPRVSICWLEAGLSAVRLIKEQSWEAFTLGNLGLAYRRLGEHTKAIHYQEQSLQIARESQNRQAESNALGNLGLLYADVGDSRRAIANFEEVLRLAIEDGRRRDEATTRGNLGLAYHNLGDYYRAIEYQEERLQIARDIGDRHGESQALGNLGLAYSRLGEHFRALKYHEQDFQIAHDIGDRLGEGGALFNGALALEKLGNRPAAIAHAEEALKLLEVIESPHAFDVRAALTEWRGEDKARSWGSAE